MKKFFVLLWGTPLQKLQTRRAKALRVFEKAEADLRNVSNELHNEIQQIDEQVELLFAQRKAMKEERDAVDNTAAKITAILH